MLGRVVRRIGPAIPTALLAGCGLGMLPAEVDVGPGARELIITVQNLSAKPATLEVLEDGGPEPGGMIGTALPSVVAARTTQDVIFTVPQGGRWAIFVNRTSLTGPVLIAPEVPDAAFGRLAVAIQVGERGEAGSRLAANLEPWSPDE